MFYSFVDVSFTGNSVNIFDGVEFDSGTNPTTISDVVNLATSGSTSAANQIIINQQGSGNIAEFKNNSNTPIFSVDTDGNVDISNNLTNKDPFYPKYTSINFIIKT